MASCYIVMGYVGATSTSIAEHGVNGSVILTRYVAGEFGHYGQWLLAAIILMACLTTTVGLTNACAEYYQDTFKLHLVSTIIVDRVIANFGLNDILKVSYLHSCTLSGCYSISISFIGGINIHVSRFTQCGSDHSDAFR